MKAIASIALVLALVPSQNFPIDYINKILQWKCPLQFRKWPRPLQDKVLGLSIWNDITGLILSGGTQGDCLCCPWSLTLVPLKCSSRNLQFPHSVPFTKKKIALSKTNNSGLILIQGSRLFFLSFFDKCMGGIQTSLGPI